MKKVFICLIILLIIFLSFVIPNILFELEDINMTRVSYIKERNNNRIDIQAENIDLVRVIHDISNKKFNVEIEDSQNMKKSLVENIKAEEGKNTIISKIQNEIIKLKDYNILNDRTIEAKKAMIIQKRYQNAVAEYIINRTWIEIDGEEINIETENKTGKAIYIAFRKDKLIEGLELQEIMYNYVKYLDLYVIDDWKFENNMLISDKAGLAIILNFYNNDICFLTINSKDTVTLANNYKLLY